MSVDLRLPESRRAFVVLVMLLAGAAVASARTQASGAPVDSAARPRFKRRKQRLLQAYLHLSPWPDAAETLQRLHAAGIRVIALANFSPAMLRANAEHAGLTGLFDAFVSTDANQTYKPDPRAYRLGLNHLRLARRDVVFAAFGGWDAAGATSFGYPTVWVNRVNQPVEELGVRPDWIVTDLNGLLDIVLN